jgi:hypothetical protein
MVDAGIRLLVDARKIAAVVLCVAAWGCGDSANGGGRAGTGGRGGAGTAGRGSGGVGATGGASGGSGLGGTAGAAGSNPGGRGGNSGSGSGGVSASSGTNPGGSSGVAGEAGSEGGDGGVSAGMGGVSPGGTTGTSGTGGDTPDPYGPCDGSLGLQNNPDCPVENSNCQQGGCVPSCPGGAPEECPFPLGGTTDTACRFELCYLVCGSEDCPSEMTCVSAVCRWQ